nr:MAG TPA: hypothetical protein [Caudoviricetes sp.]
MDNKLKETYMKTHYAGEVLDELYDKDIVEVKEILLYTLQQLELSEMAGYRYKYVEELMEEFRQTDLGKKWKDLAEKYKILMLLELLSEIIKTFDRKGLK